jgi:hypothetical protein
MKQEQLWQMKILHFLSDCFYKINIFIFNIPDNTELVLATTLATSESLWLCLTQIPKENIYRNSWTGGIKHCRKTGCSQKMSMVVVSKWSYFENVCSWIKSPLKYFNKYRHLRLCLFIMTLYIWICFCHNLHFHTIRTKQVTSLT